MSNSKKSGKRSGKRPHPIDAHVGERVRLRRMMLGMPQGKLASSLGIAFQQVQKYEKGQNRISAGRLWDISRILDVPVTFFFEGMTSAPLPEGSSETHGVREPDSEGPYYPSESESLISGFVSSREGYHLVSAFIRIEDPKVRRQLIDLARVLASDTQKKFD